MWENKRLLLGNYLFLQERFFDIIQNEDWSDVLNMIKSIKAHPHWHYKKAG